MEKNKYNKWDFMKYLETKIYKVLTINIMILHDIKYKYPKSLIIKTLTEHQKKYINFITFVEYYFRIFI